MQKAAFVSGSTTYVAGTLYMVRGYVGQVAPFFLLIPENLPRIITSNQAIRTSTKPAQIWPIYPDGFQ
jgi:hypothetical protein